MHPLDASLCLQPSSDPPTPDEYRFTGCTSEHYWNAIGPFGGWIGAALLKAVTGVPGIAGSPAVLDANFMGGIREGEIEFRVHRVRQNRSVGFWRSEIWQRGRICAQAQVTMAIARSTMSLRDARCPPVPPPENLPLYDNPRPPVRFIRQYLYKPVSGVLFRSAESMRSLLWMRDAQARPLDAHSLTSICDTPFPPMWIRLDHAIPVSTVTYTVYFRASPAELAEAGEDYVLLDSGCDLAQDGFADQFTSIWSRGGRLLAQTQQLMWFSDAPAAD